MSTVIKNIPFIGGNTQTMEFDFGTKVANSTAECPLKIYTGSIDPNKPPAPTDTAWREITKQSVLDKLKTQNGNTIVETTKNEVCGNIISHNAPCDGQMNIEIGGNTLNIYKDPIVSDFKGKESGSVVENPNISKRVAYTSLVPPTDVAVAWKEIGQTGTDSGTNYDNMKSLDGSTSTYSWGVNGAIPQQLFCFNIIEEIKRKYGITLTVEQAKQQIESIKCNWYGKGSCPGGNSAQLDMFIVSENKYYFHDKYSSYLHVGDSYNNTANIKGCQINIDSNGALNGIDKMLDSNGFIHFIAYTDASDGVAPSTIFTDYVDIEIQLKPQYQSVGEKQSDGQYKIPVISRGKNLFDKGNIYNDFYIEYQTGFMQSNPNYCASDFISIAAGKTYHKDDKCNQQYAFYNKNKKYTHGVKSSNLISPIAGDCYIRLSVEKSIIDTFQLEEGTTATPYKSYKEDKINILTQDELRGLPNGTRDTASGDTVTRKVGETILNENTFNDGFVLSGNVYYAKVSLSTLNLNIKNSVMNTQSIFGVNNDGIFINNIQGTSTVKGIATYLEGLWIVFPISMGLDTKDKINNYLKLNPITMYYELATPTIEKLPQPLNLESFKNGSLEVVSTIPPYLKEYHTTNIDDDGVAVYGSSTTGLAQAYLVECDLTPMCNALYGGSNSALKNALKYLSIGCFACGSSDKDGQLVNSTKWHIWAGTAGGYPLANVSPPTSSSIIENLSMGWSTTTYNWVKNFISDTNKIYVVITSPYSASDTIPSICNLDYVSVKVDLARIPDAIEPIPIELTEEWSMLVKGFSPAWDNHTDYKNIISLDSYTTGIGLYVRDNNAIVLNFKNGKDSCTSKPLIITKYRNLNILLGIKDNKLFLYIMENGGVLQKISPEKQEIVVMGKKVNLKVGQVDFAIKNMDAFLDSIIYMPNKTWTDTEAEEILRGTKDGFENAELFDINKVTLHSNAKLENGVIILNATGQWQNSTLNIPVLPNNQYILSANLNLPFIYIDEYYSNNFLGKEYTTLANGNPLIFTTGKNTNKITIGLSNSTAGTFTFKDISLKLKM